MELLHQTCCVGLSHQQHLSPCVAFHFRLAKSSSLWPSYVSSILIYCTQKLCPTSDLHCDLLHPISIGCFLGSKWRICSCVPGILSASPPCDVDLLRHAPQVQITCIPTLSPTVVKRMESNANQHPVGMISKMCLPRYACFCCSPVSKIKESGCLKNQHVLQHESSRNGQEKKATTSLLSRPCLFQFYLLLLHQLSNDFEAMIGVSLPRLPVCMPSSSLAKASGHP